MGFASDLFDTTSLFFRDRFVSPLSPGFLFFDFSPVLLPSFAPREGERAGREGRSFAMLNG